MVTFSVVTANNCFFFLIDKFKKIYQIGPHCIWLHKILVHEIRKENIKYAYMHEKCSKPVLKVDTHGNIISSYYDWAKIILLVMRILWSFIKSINTKDYKVTTVKLSQSFDQKKKNKSKLW